MNRTILALTAALLLAAGLAAASTPTPGGRPYGDEQGASPTEVTRSVKYTVKEVMGDGKFRVVAEDEREQVLQLGETVEFRAQNKKQFDGRKKLTLADIREGQRLKLTFLAENGQLLRVTVLKSRG